MTKSNEDLIREVNELKNEMKQMREILNMLFTIVVESDDGDDDDFGGADLVEAQPEDEHEHQQGADDDGGGIAFHGDEFLDGGTLKFKRSSRILSSRSKITTSEELVTSRTYFRALAVERAKA